MPECVRLGWTCFPVPFDRDHRVQWWKIPHDFSGNRLRLGWTDLSGDTLDGLFGPAIPRITGPLMVSSRVNQPFSFTIRASGNPTSFNANVPPPAGLAFTPPNQITGTPTAVGQTDVTLEATNPEGTGSRGLRINITDEPVGPPPPAGSAFYGPFTPSGTPTFMTMGGTPDEALVKQFGTRANPAAGQTINIPNVQGNFGFLYALPAPRTAVSVVNIQAGTDILPALSTTTLTIDGASYNVYWQRQAAPYTVNTQGHTLTIG